MGWQKYIFVLVSMEHLGISITIFTHIKRHFLRHTYLLAGFTQLRKANDRI